MENRISKFYIFETQFHKLLVFVHTVQYVQVQSNHTALHMCQCTYKFMHLHVVCSYTVYSASYFDVKTVLSLVNLVVTDYELARLQERLLQTEMMMERIVSAKGHGSGR